MARRGRRYAREFLLEVLFEAASRRTDRYELLEERAQDAGIGDEDLNYAEELCTTVSERIGQIDARIATAAPLWPLNQLAKVDLSILRLATAELVLESTPVPVVIDEAVRLAKRYGGETAGSFVNGALGSIVRSMGAPVGASEAT